MSVSLALSSRRTPCDTKRSQPAVITVPWLPLERAERTCARRVAAQLGGNRAAHRMIAKTTRSVRTRDESSTNLCTVLQKL